MFETMKHLRLFSAMICLLAVAGATAVDEPTGKGKGGATTTPAKVTSPKDATLVEGLVVKGALTQVIGYFVTYGRPSVGNTFEIDLSNLPKEKMEFTRNAEDRSGHSGPYPSYIPFSVPLMIERVRQEEPVAKPGRAVIHLSANDGGRKFLIQVQADSLEKGSKVRVLFYQDGGFIGSMAEAEGVFK